MLHARRNFRAYSFWLSLVTLVCLGLACSLDHFPGTSVESTDAPDLDEAIFTARGLITSAQQQGGNWIPKSTRSPAYESPVNELEVTTTGMMLSVLRPIGESYCLQSEVNRAFEFLSAQIEDSGLVRFYGRNNHLSRARTFIGDSPDDLMNSDLGDTALAWLVATPTYGRSRLPSMLDHIKKHVDENQMYRTWLGDPDSKYMQQQSRNPIDIQTLSELYLVLQHRRVDLEEAGRICDFLQANVNKEEYWVWFRYAPLVPLLTLYDMEVAGCPLEVDPALTVPKADHQEEYIWLIETLIDLSRIEYTTPPSNSEIESIMRRLVVLAEDDFQTMYTHPPLVYNAEIVAPRAFWWLPEFGIALWLRVAEKVQRFLSEERERPWCPGIGGFINEVPLR